MSSRGTKLYLEDILTSITRIADYIQNLSFDEFQNNQLTIDAVVRNLEIVGEAAKNIPEDFTEKHSSLPWREMVTMRNKVIHEYSGVDLDILWKTVREDLPALKGQVQELLETA
ncbi:hypothetical protein A3A14_02940 [Candidatus Daviesbacteria bacterium RIFCSPLOWO2_01_FULL_43_38]|nr:MAG: hypothetical protein A2874_03525 [Candidatus Daviesbacteria bacterium RIFCSPHIGHO2_01_FULL_43_17]OGE35240.1 MAG: hypothetical protein A3E45_03660 [Candidatus Daviesbacteria bacterium RIFCSPHIGHO2_12_FULL_43_11]OGE63585.1 MAG: hypothetical protein A3A14_02940 [Candidatus Daviesbacteria bacterium RIFCSPLOWO2_01_FULL_43_38]OGE69204.1 MAG: hypothetical protein A3J21_01625 [Candidatus Daviesbacteria bacterium RIFCSPLOWO2_02_FULL_43_11]